MVRIDRVLTAIALILLGCTVAHAQPTPAPQRPKSREFRFTYQATVTGLEPGQAARVWLPVPPTNEAQEVTVVKRDLPGEARLGKETKYGNQMFCVHAKANAQGEIPLAVTYRVKRSEVRGESKGEGREADDPELFLQPDARVPVGGKCLELLKGRTLPNDQTAAARLLYETVNGHMRYSKEGIGWGRGDAVWACESGFGNCSDFHSLFISMARAQGIPTKFVMGFPLPEKHGAGEIAGYHCWAKFRPRGKGWIPVDISEANKNPGMADYYFGNLTENRVAFTVGRDLTLVPKQEGPPLNFFIYPYVETVGKPYPDEKVRRRFSYEDVGERKG
jgi:hypothetical protein